MADALYNENDPKTAAWLGELVKLGGWPYALRLAGWPEDRPVWTGSCPCQPFSNAGKRAGTDDARHLWPDWLRLIAKCRPPAIFGEQVASRLGREWLAGVRADLEALGYEVGAADLCAAGVGAPHIRQRLFWVAESEQSEVWRRGLQGPDSGVQEGGGRTPDQLERSGASGRLADSESKQVGRTRQSRELSDGRMADSKGGDRRLPILQRGPQQARAESQRDGEVGRVVYATRPEGTRLGPVGLPLEPEQAPERCRNANPWAESDLIGCADGVSRRIESGTFPLAHGVPARVVRLRGYGNAIVPQVAAAFVRAYLDAENG